jgi:hypothetical protein
MHFFEYPPKTLFYRSLVRIGLNAEEKEEIVGRSGDKRLPVRGYFATVARVRKYKLRELCPCAGRGLGSDRTP